VQNQLISAFDSLHASDKVIVVATSDKPDLISPEFFKPGRFDRTIHVPSPDRKMRSELFKLYLKEVPRKGEFDYESLADKTEGYSCEDISNIVNEAKLSSIRDNFYTGTDEETPEDYGVRMEDVIKAMQQVKPSLSQEIITRSQAFKESMAQARKG
jgi:SpoVK/Ycf46/Vps4 family AAA+-type ATPase